MPQGATFGFFHDILVTENYYVAVENPIRMNFGRLLTSYTLGRACLAECLESDQQRRTRIHLIPRPGSSSAPCPCLLYLPQSSQRTVAAAAS
jgi:all-trans-8'-apo-beta-carotenal 15,15'-oxygenase